MIWHLTLYWCISTLDFILMSFDTWLHIDVFRWIHVLLMCISLHFCYILYILWCILCISAVFSKKIQIENISVKYHFKCQWRTLSVTHLNWVHRRYYAWCTPFRCATDRTHSRGVYRRAPLIIYTSGLICVAHHRCATKPQNGAPQIGFLLVV
jgi:hypothetical protein